MTACMLMSWLMFNIADVTSHTESQFSEPSLMRSQAFLECALNKSNSSPTSCGFGAALNVTEFPGSASVEEQRRLFLEWTLVFQAANWEFRGLTNFTVFPSPADMESAYMLPDSRLVGGVVLDFSSFPSFVSSDIRVSAEYLPAPITSSKPSLFIPAASTVFGGATAFQRSGFSWLQLRVDTALALSIKQHSMIDIPDICNTTWSYLVPELCNASLPAPNSPTTDGSPLVPNNGTFEDPPINSTINDIPMLPLMMNVSSTAWPRSKLASALFLVIIPSCLSWVFLGAVYLTIFDMVGDRVSKLKEYLKIMGMKELSYWLSNVLRMSILLSPILVILSITSMITGFFGAASNTALGIFILLLFTLNTIAFALLVAAVSPSTSIATFVTILYFFIPLIASFLVNISATARYCLALLAPFNFQWAIIHLVKLKAINGLGPVRELPSALSAISDYSIGGSIGFFILDTLLYAFLAWYFSEILGGSDDLGGSPKPWNFLFTKSYWIEMFGSSYIDRFEFASLNEEEMEDKSVSEVSECSSLPRRDSAHFEPVTGEPSELRIRIRGLVKHYKGAEVNAVNSLDLDIFQGIFVLLGENGSGKSSTISMLSGLIPSTSGSAEVDGKDISTQLDAVRDSISICPQHDLLSSHLTGSEHLRLFGILKGVPHHQLEERINDSLQDVGLGNVGDKLVGAYSGGMKRSLSLAISLIAKSRVVFIDEASSGMDMEKRRSLWDMLLRKKNEGSTLVLTTHYMEEAEMLGDRIGIMHRGNLVREGSLDFLKRELGYQIHKANPKSITISSSPKIELLPIGLRDELPNMLRALEADYEHVAVTTPNLEEVFIQIGKSLDKASIDASDSVVDFGDKLTSTLSMDTPSAAPRTQQVWAYWKKRARAESRHWGTLLCFVLVPIIITAIAMFFTQASTSFMTEFPKNLQAARSTGETVPLTFEPSTSLPLQIPYVSNGRQSLLDIWQSASDDLTLKYLGIDEAGDVLHNYLWNGTDSTWARLGGLSVLGNTTVDLNNATQIGTDSNQTDFGNLDLSANYTAYIVGIEYNQSDVYSLSRLTNFIDNAITSHYLNRSLHNLSNPFIRVRSVPFSSKAQADDRMTLILLSFTMTIFNTQFAFLVCMAFAILGGQIGKQITEELEKQIIPQMQRVGFASSTFWVANLLFNSARITVSALLTMIVVAFFQEDLFMGVSFLPFAISLLLQAWTAVLLAALISKLFTNPATAQRFIHIILCLMAMLPSTLQLMCSALASTLENQTDNFFWDLSKVAPLLSPMATLVAVVKEICNAYMLDWTTPSASKLFSITYVGKPLLVQSGYFAASIVALFAMEIYRSKIRIKSVVEPLEYSPLSMDIISEESRAPVTVPDRLESMEDKTPVSLAEEEVLMDVAVNLNHLWKRYPGAPRRSVVDTSLTVPRGMCFGLLGPNGAGKSTTISMLIGDVSPSGGSYSLDGIDAIGRNRNELYEYVRLACCLQIDSLYDDLTVTEHLELFLSVRNDLSEFHLQNVTYEILTLMKLLPHAHKLACQLSGGNKRKLCTALAALTFNNIVVLDEPSAGCDPSMRRNLWSVLKSVQAHNKALILTTHSMDEADACCNRIGIMVNGQVVSLGTPQALKAKCGGYELQIILPAIQPSEFGMGPSVDHDQQIHALEDDLLRPNFPALVLVDRDIAHDGCLVLKYDVGLVTSISRAFDILHAAFKERRFIDYSMSQMTLATAYQRLVRQQSADAK